MLSSERSSWECTCSGRYHLLEQLHALSLKKMSSPQVTAAHIAPLEPECLTGTFDSFAGDCCHGFILLLTLDIDMHVNLPSLAQDNEWPRD